MLPRNNPFRSRTERLRIGIAITAYAACCGNASALEPSTPTVQKVPTRIIIVRSKEVEPYKQAEASFVSSLPSGVETQSFSIAEATSDVLSKSAEDPYTTFFAIGSEAASSVKRAIPTESPLICAMVSDPATAGIFNARSTTVVSMDCPYATQIKLISAALPKVRRIGVLYNSETAKGKRAVDGMQAALPSGWTMNAIAVDKEASVADAITKMFESNIDLVWTYPDSSLYDTATIKALLLDSLRRTVPVFGFSSACVRAGAVVGVGTTPSDQGRQAAGALVQVKGEAGDGDDRVIPPETSTYVNTIVAERLGLVLPPKVVESASTVFKGE